MPKRLTAGCIRSSLTIVSSNYSHVISPFLALFCSSLHFLFLGLLSPVSEWTSSLFSSSGPVDRLAGVMIVVATNQSQFLLVHSLSSLV
ncbi:hypothetical protein BJX70DRAFT_381971 [Aspergillus crustosus]